MKVKTLIRSMTLNENAVKQVKIHFGIFSGNVILDIKDMNNISVLEKGLLMFIEDNEEVNSFSYENGKLYISLK